jgi:hypothetical protein
MFHSLLFTIVPYITYPLYLDFFELINTGTGEMSKSDVIDSDKVT